MPAAHSAHLAITVYVNCGYAACNSCHHCLELFSLSPIDHSNDPFDNIADEGFLLLHISFGLLLAVTHLSVSSGYAPNVSKLRRLPLGIPGYLN